MAFSVIGKALLASTCLLSTLFAPSAQYRSESVNGLVEQFENTTVFWKQFDVAKKIAALRDKSVLPHLESWLHYADMRCRGNAAFIFASLGDDRGFQVIKAILEDRSAKRVVFGIDDTGRPSLGQQIRADRYYAAHLLGDLRDPRAFPFCFPY
jgi:hypothetical protein